MKPVRHPLFNVLLIAAVLVGLGLVTTSARADAPPTQLSYQGLVQVAGVPFTGTGYFKFAIVNAATGDGASYWLTGPETLTVSNGLFDFMLGSTTALPSSVFDHDPIYLRVWFSQAAIGPFQPLEPNQRIGSAAYALRAEHTVSADDAAKLGGVAASDYLTTVTGDARYPSKIELSDPGAINGPANPVDWTKLKGVPAGFADGADDDTLGGLSCADGQIARWNGSAWACVALGTSSSAGNVPAANTFSTLDSAGNVWFSSVTIGADGLGLISYYDASNTVLKVAHCEDVDCTSATVSTPDSAAHSGLLPSVIIGADGLGLISYFDDYNSDLKVAHCDDLACTSATVTTLDSAGDVGLYTSVAVGADGLGLISYYDGTNRDLKVAHCEDLTCSSATVTTLADFVGAYGSFSSIAIGADGLGLISYYDEVNLRVRVAHCSNVTCTAATFANADSSYNVGMYSSITIGADGLGLISYYDGTGRNLKVAHCSNVACSFATTATLDSAGDVGSHTSITIGADGVGLISYRDATNSDLKVAHCADLTCSSAVSLTLDSAENVGEYTSATIGADGLALISYVNRTSSDLKVAHCASTFCTPYFRRR